MKKILLSTIVALSVISCMPQQMMGAAPSSIDQMMNSSVSKVVKINGLSSDMIQYGMLGSGYFIKNGYLLTNAHLVSEYDMVQVEDVYGNKYQSVVVARDIVHDLALLKTSKSTHKYFNFAIARPKDGSYYTVGSTLKTSFHGQDGKLLTDSMQVEIFDNYNILLSSIKRDIYSMESQPGMSGSPIFDMNGEIIGMIAGKLEENAKYPTNSAIAIQPQDIAQFLKDNNM